MINETVIGPSDPPTAETILRQQFDELQRQLKSLTVDRDRHQREYERFARDAAWCKAAMVDIEKTLAVMKRAEPIENAREAAA